MISRPVRLLLISILLLTWLAHAAPLSPLSYSPSMLMKTKAPVSFVEVIHAYPHDSEAFTQGLVFHEGFLYESTGINGRSGLFKKEIQTGKVLQETKIAREYFGEGIVFLKNKIYQLTWQNEMLIVYDAESFKEIKKLKYSGEGWGLATNGKHLLRSDGSSTITFHDPGSFKIVRKINVRDGDMPVERLNELEMVKGEIWANIYLEDLIVRISPKNGKVKGWIDLSTLRSYLPKNAQVDVINGIAYDEKSDRIFVTGKFWPKLFEIKIVK